MIWLYTEQTSKGCFGHCSLLCLYSVKKTASRLGGCFVKIGQSSIMGPTWNQTAEIRALRYSPISKALLPLLNVVDE